MAEELKTAAVVTDENRVAQKVLQLTIERNQFKDRKKASNAGYNEEIKRIEAEIKDLIDGKDKDKDKDDE